MTDASLILKCCECFWRKWNRMRGWKTFYHRDGCYGNNYGSKKKNILANVPFPPNLSHNRTLPNLWQPYSSEMHNVRLVGRSDYVVSHPCTEILLHDSFLYNIYWVNNKLIWLLLMKTAHVFVKLSNSLDHGGLHYFLYENFLSVCTWTREIKDKIMPVFLGIWDNRCDKITCKRHCFSYFHHYFIRLFKGRRRKGSLSCPFLNWWTPIGMMHVYKIWCTSQDWLIFLGILHDFLS